jgi:hypothetical protein
LIISHSRPRSAFTYLSRADARLILEQPAVRDRLCPSAELARHDGRGINLPMDVEDPEEIHGKPP